MTRSCARFQPSAARRCSRSRPKVATASTTGSKAPARPSSLPSELLFAGTYARGAVASQLHDAAWLQAMLDVEAALAGAYQIGFAQTPGDGGPGGEGHRQSAEAVAARRDGSARGWRLAPPHRRTVLRRGAHCTRGR